MAISSTGFSEDYILQGIKNDLSTLKANSSAIEQLGEVEPVSERRSREIRTRGYSMTAVDFAPYCARRDWLSVLTKTMRVFLLGRLEGPADRRENSAFKMASEAYVQIPDLSVERAYAVTMDAWQSYYDHACSTDSSAAATLLELKTAVDARFSMFSESQAKAERLCDQLRVLDGLRAYGVTDLNSRELSELLQESLSLPGFDAIAGFQIVGNRLQELKAEAANGIGTENFTKTYLALLEDHERFTSLLESDFMLCFSGVS